jgi:hypothetical protein
MRNSLYGVITDRPSGHILSKRISHSNPGILWPSSRASPSRPHPVISGVLNPIHDGGSLCFIHISQLFSSLQVNLKATRVADAQHGSRLSSSFVRLRREIVSNPSTANFTSREGILPLWGWILYVTVVDSNTINGMIWVLIRLRNVNIVWWYISNISSYDINVA